MDFDKRVLWDESSSRENGIGQVDVSVILPLCGKGLVINYGEGGYKMGKLRFRNLLPPSRQGKTFCPPQERVTLFAPPFLHPPF